MGRPASTHLCALAAAALLAAGCDGAWQAYEQIQLGKPIPTGHVLLREGRVEDGGGGRARGTYEYSRWLIVSTLDGVSVFVDASGNVTAKRYVASAAGYWGLLMSSATRTVLEVQIPGPAFHDRPLHWQEPPYQSGQFDELFRLEKSLVPLAREAAGEFADRTWYGETYPSPLADRETHTHALQIADNRLTENVRSKLRRATGDVPVKLGTDVDLSGLAQANYIRKVNPDAAVFRSEDGRVFLKFSLTIPRTPAADIVDFIDALQFPFPSAESHEFFGPHMNCPLLLHSVYGLYMWHHNKVVRLTDLGEYPAALQGMTRTGFDWTYTNWAGGTIRVQNLGNRRIRIESKALTLCDPLLLTAILSFPFYDEDHLYKTVIGRCTQMIRTDPRNPTGYVLRAATHAKKNHWKEAQADCAKAVELAPDDPEIHNACKAIKARARRFDVGAVEFSRDLSWGSEAYFPNSYRVGGIDYDWSNDEQRAVADYTRVINTRPSHAVAYNNRGVSLYRLGRCNEALADFTKAVTLDPEYPDAYHHRACAHARLRQYAKAWADVDACKAAGGYIREDLFRHLLKAAPRKK